MLQCSSCFARKIPEETEMRAALSLAPITLLQLTFLTALHGRSPSVTYRETVVILTRNVLIVVFGEVNMQSFETMLFPVSVA